MACGMTSFSSELLKGRPVVRGKKRKRPPRTPNATGQHDNALGLKIQLGFFVLVQDLDANASHCVFFGDSEEAVFLLILVRSTVTMTLAADEPPSLVFLLACL